MNNPVADEAVRCLWRLAGSAGDLYRLIGRLGEAVAADGCADLPAAPPVSPGQRAQLAAKVSAAARVVTKDAEQFRHAHVAALHADGISPEDLARLFGLSRQRVSVLVHGSPAARDWAGSPGREPAP